MVMKMKKGRSNYSFNINCDVNIAKKLIQSYLLTNKFQLVTKNNEQYYRAGEPWLEGYKVFSYSIVGQVINIEVWTLGIFGGEYPIDGKALNIVGMNYTNSLNVLFKELVKMCVWRS